MVDTALATLLDEMYVGLERVPRDEIQRRAAAEGLPAGVRSRIDALPEGEYAQDEVIEALNQLPEPGMAGDDGGDFAAEHSSVVAGPDLGREEESPRGFGGMDYRRR